MSDLVVNPEDMFSPDAAPVIPSAASVLLIKKHQDCGTFIDGGDFR